MHDERLRLRVSRFVELLLSQMATIPLRVPLAGEREPTYVASAIAPQINIWLRSLNLSSIHLGGEGLGPVRAGTFLGRLVLPDLTIFSHDMPVLALEAKFLRFSSLAGDASKAVGQAMLYRSSGYPYSAILFLDVERAVESVAIESGRKILAAMEIELIFRQRVSTQFSRDIALLGQLRSNKKLAGGRPFIDLTADEARNIDSANI